MRTIWKYELDITDSQTLEMPINADILTVQIQRETAQLWALVNPELSKENRYIQIYGTGHNVTEDLDLKYISTIQLQSGDLIFHIFEVV